MVKKLLGLMVALGLAVSPVIAAEQAGSPLLIRARMPRRQRKSQPRRQPKKPKRPKRLRTLLRKLPSSKHFNRGREDYPLPFS